MTTAAEALEEVLALRSDRASAALCFVLDHADTLRAALAPPQEGEVEECLRDLDVRAELQRGSAVAEVCSRAARLLRSAHALLREVLEQTTSPDYEGGISDFTAARLLRATQSNGRPPVGDESPRQNAKGAEGCHDAPNASGESPAQSAPAQEPVITVSGPVACGKSYIMELIYKALRDAGLHPYSDDLAHERRMVEEQPQPPAKVWKLREAVYAAPQPDKAREWIALTDEDREAAFNSLPGGLEGFLKTWGWLHFAKEIERRCKEKQNTAPQPDEARALLVEVVRRYDDYRGKGVAPAPGEYQMVVGAIERIRAYLEKHK